MKNKGCMRALRFAWFLVLCLAAVGEDHHVQATAPTTLNLIGTGYLEVADNRLLDPSTGLTLEAWVKLASEPGSGTCWTVAGKNYLTSYWLGGCGRTPRFYPAGSGTYFDAAASIPVGEWIHLAATYDGFDGIIYINGVLSGGRKVIRAMPGNADPFQIGADMGQFPFRGMIADVRLWGQSRTQEEIRLDMLHLPDTRRTSLLGAWHLEGGAGEYLNRMNASQAGGVTWTGNAAPAVLYNPILIPRLPGAPWSLSSCNSTEYTGALRVPIWYEDGHFPPNPVWVNVGATATDFYICMENVDLEASFTAVYLDVDNSGGTLAQTHDYQLRIDEDGPPESNAGNGAGGFSGPALPGWDAAFYVSEMYVSSGFRIPRSAISSLDGSFRLMFAHHWIGGVAGNDFDWPVNGVWNSPASWVVFRINDSGALPSDNQNPEVSADHAPAPVIRQGQPVTITAMAWDDTDLAEMEIFVDGSVKQECSFPLTGETSGTCAYETIPTLGPHTYYARVIDQRGRLGYSAAGSFITQAGGNLLTVVLSHTPRFPASAQLITINVEARDSYKITQLTLSFDVYPYHVYCPLTGQAVETCSASIQAGGQSIVHYWANAEDVNYQSVTTNRMTILLGNAVSPTNPDTDDDGIVDRLEMLIGTHPDNPDTDRDTLLDGWEVSGLSFPDGESTDLPGMGSNPLRKDIFVQYDYERGAHVGPFAFPVARQLFRRNGINLWATEIERPRTGIASTLTAETAAIELDSLGHYYFNPKLTWTHHYLFSRHSLGRSSAFYNVTLNVNTGGDCPMDSPEPQTDPDCRPHDQNGRHVSRDFARSIYLVIHELGHNLGLGHGGRTGVNGQVRFGDAIGYVSEGGAWNNLNQKTNYLSLMNYLYSSGGPICVDPMYHVLAQVDFDHAYLPALQEAQLNEQDSTFRSALESLECPAGWHSVIAYSCITPAGVHQLRITDGNSVYYVQNQGSVLLPVWLAGSLVSGGIDWNCNNTLETEVQANINGDGGENIFQNGWITDTLTTNNDWAGIPYEAGKGCWIAYALESRTYFPVEYREEVGNPDCRIDSTTGQVDRLSEPLLANSEDPPFQVEMTIENFPDEAPLPELETCNGLDDDSDQAVDEDCPDLDGDGTIDALDNCLQTWNPDQVDLDGNYLGDTCQYPPATDLQVTFDELVNTLYWNGSTYDLLGYNVYRRCSTDNTMGLLQAAPGDFPTTQNTFYTDAKNGRAGCSYCVAAVNMLGQESEWICRLVYQSYLPAVFRD